MHRKNIGKEYTKHEQWCSRGWEGSGSIASFTVSALSKHSTRSMYDSDRQGGAKESWRRVIPSPGGSKTHVPGCCPAICKASFNLSFIEKGQHLPWLPLKTTGHANGPQTSGNCSSEEFQCLVLGRAFPSPVYVNGRGHWLTPLTGGPTHTVALWPKGVQVFT
jgi:hypothetical protein